MLPFINIFGSQVNTYGICAAIGLFVSLTVGYFLVRKKGICYEDLIVTAVYVVFGILIGSHVLFGVTNIPNIIDLFKNASQYDFIDFMTKLFGEYLGGMVYYGGFLGGLAALALTYKYSKFGHSIEVFDMFAVCIPLFHTFGRIGCFLGGCCYGMESEFGFTAHGNTVVPSVNDVNRFPVQLVESAGNLLIFFFLLFLYKKEKFVNRLIIAYLYVYPVVRFTLEFFRGDTYRGFLFGLSTSQIVSLVLFIFAIVFTIVDRLRVSGKPKEAAPAQ